VSFQGAHRTSPRCPPPGVVARDDGGARATRRRRLRKFGGDLAGRVSCATTTRYRASTARHEHRDVAIWCWFGLMGAGKSTVGGAAARNASTGRFVDTDDPDRAAGPPCRSKRSGGPAERHGSASSNAEVVADLCASPDPLVIGEAAEARSSTPTTAAGFRDAGVVVLVGVHRLMCSWPEWATAATRPAARRATPEGALGAPRGRRGRTRTRRPADAVRRQPTAGRSTMSPTRVLEAFSEVTRREPGADPPARLGAPAIRAGDAGAGGRSRMSPDEYTRAGRARRGAGYDRRDRARTTTRCSALRAAGGRRVRGGPPRRWSTSRVAMSCGGALEAAGSTYPKCSRWATVRMRRPSRRSKR